MRLYFRPLPALTLFGGLLFAILVWLGVWQLERLQWKLALIASVNANLAAPPVTLDHAMLAGAMGSQYHRVRMDGRFDNTKEAYVFTTGPDGAPVYHVVTPFETASGTFLVDRGLVPIEKRDPATRRAGELEGPIGIVGVWRIPDAPGAFTPAPDPAHRVWYARDLAGIAQADRVKLVEPVIVEADAAPNPGGWPEGGQTQVTFRNEHLQYAITWFALAAGLLGVYLAYHVSRGRLGFLPPKSERH